MRHAVVTFLAIIGTELLQLGPQTAAAAASPSPAASPAGIPVIGPRAAGDAPVPPIGPAWELALDRPFPVVDAEVVACGEGFTALAFGEGQARVWRTGDGTRWVRGAAPGPDRSERDSWSVHRLVRFGDDLVALGGVAHALAVWRSPDCGASWERVRDRRLALGPDDAGITGIEAAATKEHVLVVGSQGGEGKPARRWAWRIDREGALERIPGALEAAVAEALTADGASFTALAPQPPGGLPAPMVTSADGLTWTPSVVPPDPFTPAVRDAAPGRWLAPADEARQDGVVHRLLAATDGTAWTPVAESELLPDDSAARVVARDGVLVWTVDVGLEDDAHEWSWIGTSDGGGTTWTVSAGWPGMALPGVQSVAVNARAIVLLATGPGFDRVRILVLPR